MTAAARSFALASVALRHGWLLLLASAAPLAGQQKINRRIAIAADASIRINNLAGPTRIIGWDQDSLVATGMAPRGVSFFMGGAGRLAKMGLERDEEGSAVVSPMLEVRVPRGARVWVKSTDGSIEASDMTGELDLTSAGGSITVNGSLRVVSAETIEGDIEVTGPSPLVRVKTGGGRIALRRPGGDVSASTVSGPIVASEATPASARLETISGPVTFEGEVDRSGTLDIQTHSGDVELHLPAKIAAEFDLQSMDGAIVTSPPLDQRMVMKPAKGQPVVFATGGGGARIVVRSFKGKISVFRR